MSFQMCPPLAGWLMDAISHLSCVFMIQMPENFQTLIMTWRNEAYRLAANSSWLKLSYWSSAAFVMDFMQKRFMLAKRDLELNIAITENNIPPGVNRYLGSDPLSKHQRGLVRGRQLLHELDFVSLWTPASSFHHTLPEPFPLLEV